MSLSVSAFQEAFRGLTKKELAGLAATSPAIHFSTFVQIFNKDNQLIRPRPNILQLRMSQVYEQCMAWGIPCRMIVCKPRQVGCSTFAAHIVYHHEQRHRTDGLTIADIAENSKKLMKKVADYANRDSFPWGHKMRAMAQKLTMSNGSEHEIDSAENWKAGISRTRQVLHLCLGVDTPVICPNGKLRALGKLHVGDQIRTHTGKTATISYISEQIKSAYRVKLRGLAHFPLVATSEHKFWTKSGFKTLAEIREEPDPHIGFPVTAITDEGISFDFALPTPIRPQGGGIIEHVPKTITPSYALGRIVGLYLAEGCISRQRNEHRRPTAILLGVHEREVDRTLEWLKEIKDLFSRVRVERRRNTKAVAICVSGRSFTEWMLGFVGETGSKRFPDGWRRMGVPFVRGLVHGYISGDGHFAKNTPSMLLTSIRSATITGLRDALASLGYGWAGIAYKEAAIRNGRNEQESWILTLCGSGVDVLAPEIGKKTLPRKRRSRGHAKSAEVSGGYAWLRITSIEPAGEQLVRDLEVDHPDHSYCILHGASSNSETGKWPKSGVKQDTRVMASVLPSVPKTPNTLVIGEGTPDGAVGWHYETWQGAVTIEKLKEMRDEGNAPPLVWIKVFAAWFEFEEHQNDGKGGRPAVSPGEARAIKKTLTNTEREGMALHGWTIAQLAWRRGILDTECGGNEDLFSEYYPSDDVSCWMVSGRPRFSLTALTTMERMTKGMRPETGTITLQDDKAVHWSPSEEGDVQIFEMPKEGCRYLVGCDPMTGADQTTGGDPDRHSIGVMRQGYYNPTSGQDVKPALVARVKPPYIADVDQAAGQIIGLSRLYGGCLTVLEVNMGLGILELLKFEGVPILQREVLSARLGHKVLQFGYKLTDRNERRYLIDALATAIRELGIVIGCPHAILECKNFITGVNGRDEARAGAHDDDVFMLAMSYISLASATLYTGSIRKRREPADRKRWQTLGAHHPRR